MPTQKTTFSPPQKVSSQLTAYWSQPSFTFSAKERDTETGLNYFGSRYYSSDLSIWLSVDPQASKYPGLSPYVYCANNPIKLVDPNGEEVYINGDEATEAFARLQGGTNLRLEMKTSGKIEIVGGKAKNRSDKLLLKAINDDKVTVNLTANRSEIIGKDENGKILVTNGGSFMGNTLEKDENGKINSASASQYVSINALDNNFELEDHGAVIIHEITEAHIGGKISMRVGKEAKMPISGADRTIYDRAHNRASIQPCPKSPKQSSLPFTPIQQQKIKNVINRINILF